MTENTEPEDNLNDSKSDGIVSDLPDYEDLPLGELDQEEAPDTERRVAPKDGTQLLVAASFNSAI